MIASVTTTLTTRSALLGRGGNRVPVNLGVPTRYGFGCERGQRMQSTRLPQGGAGVGTGEKVVQCARKKRRVRGRYENAGAIVLHDVRQTAGIGGDDRRLAHLRLDCNQAEPLVERRHNDRRSG